MYASLTYRDVGAIVTFGGGITLIQADRPEELRGYSARDLEASLWSFGTGTVP